MLRGGRRGNRGRRWRLRDRGGSGSPWGGCRDRCGNGHGCAAIVAKHPALAAYIDHFDLERRGRHRQMCCRSRSSRCEGVPADQIRHARKLRGQHAEQERADNNLGSQLRVLLRLRRGDPSLLHCWTRKAVLALRHRPRRGGLWPRRRLRSRRFCKIPSGLDSRCGRRGGGSMSKGGAIGIHSKRFAIIFIVLGRCQQCIVGTLDAPPDAHSLHAARSSLPFSGWRESLPPVPARSARRRRRRPPEQRPINRRSTRPRRR